jgi:hypothetical protein
MNAQHSLVTTSNAQRCGSVRGFFCGTISGNCATESQWPVVGCTAHTARLEHITISTPDGVHAVAIGNIHSLIATVLNSAEAHKARGDDKH